MIYSIDSIMGLVASFAGATISYVALIYALYYEKILTDFRDVEKTVNSIQSNPEAKIEIVAAIALTDWFKKFKRRYLAFYGTFWGLLFCSGIGLLGVAIVAAGFINFDHYYFSTLFRFCIISARLFLGSIAILILSNVWSIKKFRHGKEEIDRQSTEVPKEEKAEALKQDVKPLESGTENQNNTPPRKSSKKKSQRPPSDKNNTAGE